MQRPFVVSTSPGIHAEGRNALMRRNSLLSLFPRSSANEPFLLDQAHLKMCLVVEGGGPRAAVVPNGRGGGGGVVSNPPQATRTSLWKPLQIKITREIDRLIRKKNGYFYILPKTELFAVEYPDARSEASPPRTERHSSMRWRYSTRYRRPLGWPSTGRSSTTTNTSWRTTTPR